MGIPRIRPEINLNGTQEVAVEELVTNESDGAGGDQLVNRFYLKFIYLCFTILIRLLSYTETCCYKENKKAQQTLNLHYSHDGY